jgi:uncharacterized damage-inducible protein DinB
MATSTEQAMSQATSVSAKDQFLAAYDREHKTTVKVLRAYPEDRLDLKPHPKLRTARELAWVFVAERFLSMMIYNDELEKLSSGETPPPPQDWNVLLTTFEQAHQQLGDMIRQTPDLEMYRQVRFLTGPKQVGLMTRLEFLWFILSDEIHHRGQFSIYVRMADAKLPAIYGPTADEPWM